MEHELRRTQNELKRVALANDILKKKLEDLESNRYPPAVAAIENVMAGFQLRHQSMQEPLETLSHAILPINVDNHYRANPYRDV